MFMNFMNNLQHEYPCSCSETVHGHGQINISRMLIYIVPYRSKRIGKYANNYTLRLFHFISQNVAKRTRIRNILFMQVAGKSNQNGSSFKQNPSYYSLKTTMVKEKSIQKTNVGPKTIF